VFSALAGGKPAPGPALGLFNNQLAVAMTHFRVTVGEDGCHWRLAEGGEPDLDMPVWPVARDAADVLTSARLKLVRECGGDTCSWLFLDSTRNHSRQWCDMKGCGNRAKVRRHRARHAHPAR
jgi:predicted RNA-binding Zn ribbon-like protein